MLSIPWLETTGHVGFQSDQNMDTYIRHGNVFDPSQCTHIYFPLFSNDNVTGFIALAGLGTAYVDIKN